MTWEQLSALVSAVGTVGGPVVAVVAIRSGSRASALAREESERAIRLANDQLELAREERAAMMRSSVFDARLRFVRGFSRTLSSAPLLVEDFAERFEEARDHPDSPERTEAHRIAHRTLEALMDEMFAVTPEAVAVLPPEYLQAFTAFRARLLRCLNAKTPEKAEAHLLALLQEYDAILEQGRRMLHVDTLDPQLLKALGRADELPEGV